jgi:hypothetical protein
MHKQGGQLGVKRGVYNVTTHGEARRSGRTRLYQEWQNMWSRCRLSPDNPSYEAYKHVTCCPEWEQYVVFKVWALANGYAETLWLDRKNNALGYTPKNCRWVTEQVSIENRVWTPKRKSQIDNAREKQKVSVVCVGTGTRFLSVHDAAREYGCDASNIIRAIKTGQRTAGVKWSY